jgi:arsenate reductase
MNILILCTGNSCRSQIAEGWLKQLAPNGFRIISAGIEAHGKNPNAIKVMHEVGVDISDQISKIVTNEMIIEADVVITVCDLAYRNCPVVPANIEKIHWPLSDPAQATGTHDQVLNAFRNIRDEIKTLSEEFISYVLYHTHA